MIFAIFKLFGSHCFRVPDYQNRIQCALRGQLVRLTILANAEILMQAAKECKVNACLLVVRRGFMVTGKTGYANFTSWQGGTHQVANALQCDLKIRFLRNFGNLTQVC